MSRRTSSPRKPRSTNWHRPLPPSDASGPTTPCSPSSRASDYVEPHCRMAPTTTVEPVDVVIPQLHIIRHSTYGALCLARHKAPFCMIVSSQSGGIKWDGGKRDPFCMIVSSQGGEIKWDGCEKSR